MMRITTKKNDSDGEEDNSDEDIPDFEDFNGDNLEDDDECALREDAKASNGGEEDGDYVVKTRTYDICITYDNYTSTPRVWLYGYDENHKPLKQEDMFHDISQDHAKKTVTLDKHPNLDTAWLYIHPCKHAAVMKKLIAKQLEGGKIPRVDQYLFLFLKFLSAVIPTIEYDHTVEMEG